MANCPTHLQLTLETNVGIIAIVTIIDTKESMIMEVTDVGIAEARRDLSAIINRVVYGGERIILASRGKPKAAIISMEDLYRLEGMEKTADERARTERKAALAMAKAVRETSLRRRAGVPFPDVSEDLHELREERTRELSDMR